MLVGRRGDGKRGLAQGWLPLQKQERRLLRARERGPERTLFRGREPTRLRTQARKPLRQQGRWLFRNEDRARFRVQVLSRNQVLLGFEYRRPVRGPSMEPERLPLQRPERLLFPGLGRPQERGPVRGQEFPQPYRGRWQGRTKSDVRSGDGEGMRDEGGGMKQGSRAKSDVRS